MTSPSRGFGSWRPDPVTFKRVGFGLLLLSTATFLTNAYYLRFLEPALSRKGLALMVVALTGGWFLVGHFGLPKSRGELSELLGRMKTPLLLAIILGVAFSVRFEGISSGLPQSYIPDEYEYVHSYLQMIKRGDMNPRWWHHPSVQPYVNIGTYLIVFFLEARTGRWQSVHQIQVEDMLFWGRFSAGVVPGTFTVFFVFMLGRFVFGTRVGLFAAALLAVAPGVVEISQYNKPDALLVLFSTVSVLVTMIYLEKGSRGLAFAAGAAIGFTVAVKYNASLLWTPLIGATLFRRGTSLLAHPDLYLGAVGTVVGFTAGCPYFFADLTRFFDHVAAGLFNYGFLGLAGAEGVDNWATHANYTINYGAGLLPFLACLVGLALALYRIDRRLAVFLAYPIFYYSFYSSQRINFAGNLMPVYPFLAILAAYAIVETIVFLRDVLEKRLRNQPIAKRPLETFALVAALVAALWFPTSMTLKRNRLMMLPDTGAMAAQWIEARIPPGTSFAVERHTPVLDLSRYRVSVSKRVIDLGVAAHRDAGAEYLIVTSTSYERFGPEHRQTKNYGKLFAICPLVKEFAPEPERMSGPTIRILQVPAGPPP